GREEGEGTGDDRIRGAEVEGHQRKQQRIRAGGDADPEAALTQGGDIRLELLHGRSENEVLAGADPGDGGLDLLGQRLVLRLQIQQRNLYAGSHLFVYP